MKTCKIPCVFSKNGKSAIYMPYKGTIEDIYLLVHELSHTFDISKNNNSTRNMLGEVTPACFETILNQYLIKKGIATKEDAIHREMGIIVHYYDDAVETFAKLELIKIKEQQGEITQENFIEIQKKYGITNKQLGYVLRRLANSRPNIDYKARYMNALLIYPHYIEQYMQDPQKAIRTLKEYFKQIKANNFENSLKVLGINPCIESVEKLVETANRRIEILENKQPMTIKNIRSQPDER